MPIRDPRVTPLDIDLPIYGPTGRDGNPIFETTIPVNLSVAHRDYLEGAGNRTRVAQILAIVLGILLAVVLIIFTVWVFASKSATAAVEKDPTSASAKIRIKNTTEVEGMDGNTEISEKKDSALEKLKAEKDAEFKKLQDKLEEQDKKLKALEEEKDKPKDKEKDPPAKKTSASRQEFQPEGPPAKPYSNFEDNPFLK